MPKSATEQRLLDIWKELMNLRELSVTDNFFEIGGHSLLATRLLMHVNRVFNSQLSLAVLFQTPSIRQLAERIERFGHDSSRAIMPRRATNSVPVLLNQVEQLSDAEVDRLFAEMTSKK